MKTVFFILLSVVVPGGILAQNTLDKLGLPPGTPAATAYSLRLLSTGFTGAAIQVRRSSDDATQDIGFTATGDLDEPALLAFAGSGNAFVNIWYDQSGNGRDMIKTDPNYQPQIVFDDTLKHIGSRPAIDFYLNKGLVYTGSLSLNSIAAVVRSSYTYWPSYQAVLDGAPRIGGLLWAGGTSFYGDVYPLAVWKNGLSKVVSESLAPVNEGMVLSFSTKTDALSKIFIGNYDGGGDGGSVLETETIAFSSLLSDDDRQTIVCNQGIYYSVPTNCTTVITAQPTSQPVATCFGTVATPITVQAAGLNLTYQWYRSTTASNSGGSLISGANSSFFIPPTSSIDTTYYYVEVSGSAAGILTSDVSGPVYVDASPAVSISPPGAIIHSGDSITLTASGASTYLWGVDNTNPIDHVSACRLAVGLRGLSSSYSGPALRIRRSDDNTEVDFGFTDTELDLGAIATFLGASEGYCSILFDQSGAGNDLVQTNPSQQPLFVASGLNGKPVLHFSPGHFMSNPTNFPVPFSVIYLARQVGPSRGRVLAGIYNNWLLGWWGGLKTRAFFEGWVSQDPGAAADSDPYVYSATGTGSISSIYENGALVHSNGDGLVGPGGITLNGSESSDADVAELFVFNSALSDVERERIENSSGSSYGIFGNPPVAGSTFVVSPTINTAYTVTGYSPNLGCAVPQNSLITVLNNPGLSNFTDEDKLYFDDPYTIFPPASTSAGAFTYTSSNAAVATISGNTVTITGAGQSTIKVIQAQTATHFSDSTTAVLNVTTVTVVTKNGEVSNTSNNYVNKNGTLGSQTGLSVNGESITTKSAGSGSTAETAASSAYQIKLDYPSSTDGLYWIKNTGINGGIPFQIYADMTTDGGGWTLILCNTSPNAVWSDAEAILRNEGSPGVTANYSIIAWADRIKRSSSGFQYMIDAQTRRSNGGIWTANDNYSFTSTSNSNINITLDTKFGAWNYSDSDIEERMPWYAPGSDGIITTSNDANGSWWGTLIARGGWDPAPWLGSSVQNPGIIWYWVR